MTTATSRFRLHNGHLLAVALLAGLFVYLSFIPLWHTDVWAHAKYGEWYVTHKATPPTEPLSPFTDKQVPFANVAWLSQVAYYELYEMGADIAGGDAESRLRGGAEALRSFHLLMLLGRFTFLLLALRRFGGSWTWAVLGIAFYFLALRAEVAVQRPQSFGVFLFAVILYALSAPSMSRRAMFVLPIVFLFWANLHGTFVVGLAILGLHGLGRIIERGDRDADVRRLFITGVLCTLATLINPHGPMLYKHVLAFSGHPNLQTMTEWWPMKRASAGPYTMSLVFLSFVRLVGGRKIGAAGWLVALPFALWPWQQWRAITWWWAIAVWLLARLGPGLGDKFATLPSFPEGECTRAKTWIAVALVLIAALFFPPIWRRDVDHTVSSGMPWRLALELNAYPSDEGRWMPALREALRNDYPGGQFRGAIFPSETQGDFLIWAVSDKTPVMMYTHAHVFTPQYWDACCNVKQPNPGWQEFLAQRQANLIIVETDSHEELAEVLRTDAEWIIVHDGPSAPTSDRGAMIVALRKKPL